MLMPKPIRLKSWLSRMPQHDSCGACSVECSIKLVRPAVAACLLLFPHPIPIPSTLRLQGIPRATAQSKRIQISGFRSSCPTTALRRQVPLALSSEVSSLLGCLPVNMWRAKLQCWKEEREGLIVRPDIDEGIIKRMDSVSRPHLQNQLRVACLLGLPPTCSSCLSHVTRRRKVMSPC